MTTELRKDLALAFVINVIANAAMALAIPAWNAVPFTAVFVPALVTLLAVTACVLVVRRKTRLHIAEVGALQDDLEPFSTLGIEGMWRDREAFRRARGKSFGEHCVEFVRQTADADTVRVVGYSWQELFPDTQLLTNDILSGENSRLRFEIVLEDPESLVPLEKRTWEMKWLDGNNETIYPEGFQENSIVSYLLESGSPYMLWSGP